MVIELRIDYAEALEAQNEHIIAHCGRAYRTDMVLFYFTKLL